MLEVKNMSFKKVVVCGSFQQNMKEIQSNSEVQMQQLVLLFGRII